MRKAISDETNVEKIEHKSKKNIALGTIFGYGAILVSFIYGIFVTPEIVNFVGDVEYGLYGLANSIIAIFLADFGLSTAVNTYLAKLRANNDKEGVERFLASIFKIYLTLDILFVVLIAALYFSAPVVFANKYSPANIETLQYLFIIVGCYSCISVPSYCVTGVIQTYEKFSMIKLIDIFQKLVYLALSVLAIELKWRLDGSGILVIVLINVLTATTSILLRFIYMRLYLNVKLDIRKSIDRKELKGVLSFSAWGFVMTICSRLAFNLSPYILAFMGYTDAVALFTLITTLELYIYMLADLTGGFFMAKLARTEVEGTDEEKLQHLQQLSEKVGKIQFVIIGLLFLGFASVGQEFILFWMRNNGDPTKYLTIYWCIVAICAYELIHIPELIFQNAMLTHGHIKPLGIASIAKAVINIGLSFLFSYIFTESFGHMWYGAGAIGASLAIMVARVVDLAIYNFLFKKYLHVNLGSFFKSIYVRGIITLIISLGVGIGMHLMPFLNAHNFVKLLVNGFTFVFVYTLCTVFITFTKTERKYYVGIIFELLHIKRRAPADGQIETHSEEENKE